VGDGQRTRQEERKRRGRGSREREESGKCTFLNRWCTCARNCVSSRYLTSKIVLSNGNKTCERVRGYTCILSDCVAFVYVSV